ncbi:MAG: uroporphyrinogen-III C-methyltransferase [Candidatus Symbiothrix sp.]|jgi:uroporphyrinogen III methyltransferase/synthase|nr:uroporphyrinogen-III C-methyltransferase [Candidatus Symbiothrix sp.]
MTAIKVISRSSPLSVIQIAEAFASFPDITYNLETMETVGDKHKDISLMEPDLAPDFFTRELDDALLAGKADVAVHSAKDLPYPLPSELEIYALLEADDKSDSLVSHNNRNLEQLPSGARIGTSSPARRSELLRLRPDLIVVAIRGNIGERLAQIDSGYIDALIVATCALKRLGWENRIAQTLPFKTHPLQGHLAIVGKKNHPEVKELFVQKDIRKQYGKVSLAGFGPGNPDFLTLAACKSLTQADIIFHDDLLDKDFLSPFEAEKVYVGKRKNRHHCNQDEINKLLYESAVTGKNTVRLKGGDPMIFAHGREEIDFLQSRLIEVEVIPGISAGIALASCTHIPLTHRGIASSVAFVTGHNGQNIQTPNADTLVYYMGGANIADIAGKLIATGRREDLPVALAFNVSLPEQRVWFSTLKELQYSVIQYPMPILLIAGETVALENHSARHQKVLLTGTSGNGQGNSSVHTPLIQIDKIKENVHLYTAIREIGKVDWLIFTSRHGVHYFFEALNELKLDVRALSSVKIASVGPVSTAELSKYLIYPDIESATESAEGIVDYFKEMKLTGKQILLPRSDKGLKFLSDHLSSLGNTIIDIPVYRNETNTQAEKTDLSLFQKIIFSSPSGVDACTEIYGRLPEGVQLVAKGKTTLKKLIDETV